MRFRRADRRRTLAPGCNGPRLRGDWDHHRSDSIPESPHLHTIPRDPAWALAEGRRGGRPYVIRLRTDLKPVAGHPDYPIRLLATWRIRPPTDGGLPTVEEEEAMADFESLLVPALSGSGIAVLAAVLTHHGERSWLFYAGDLVQAQHSLDLLAEDFPISFAAESDPGWERYLGILRDLGLG
jgi:hypothetical protein